MALAFTLGTLVARCTQRFTGEGEGLVDPTEIKALIFEAYGEMHGLVVEKGSRHFENEVSITATGAATYALPTDHLSTVGIDAFLNDATGPRRPVYGPIMAQERTRLMGMTGAAYFYDLEGSSIALFPVPASGTYRHIYVPQPVDLSTAADSTSVDLINIWGYKFVLWTVASVALHKGSSSQQRAVDEAKRASDQIEYWACQRAINQPSYRVPDELDDVFPPADWRFR
jgi:hypothetical protein